MGRASLWLQHEVKRVLWQYRPEEFGSKKFLLKSIAYNATARSDMFTLPCSNKVCCSDKSVPVSKCFSCLLQQLFM